MQKRSHFHSQRRGVKMKTSRIILVFLWLLSTGSVFGQSWKVVIPEATKISQGHLVYPSPAVPGHTHFGADIVAACGKTIYPLTNGKVVKVTQGYSDGLGNAVMIRHPRLGKNENDMYTLYLHMEEAPNINGIALAIGDEVYSGIPIGKVGSTGFANGVCHTHFEIRNFFNPNAAGGGWYNEKSKSCSTGSLNIYACGDQRKASWALNDWQDPTTYQVSCDPTKQFCSFRAHGSVGWFPPVDNCYQASSWYILGKDPLGKDYMMGSSNVSACNQIPAACYSK